MTRMSKRDPFTVVGEEGKPQLPLQYPYYTVHHNEGKLYVLKKWDDGGIEPSDEYMVSLKPVSCSCQGMRHFYKDHREEEHKHIKIVRMFLVDQKLDKGFVLRAYWMGKKNENVYTRILIQMND